MNKLVVISDTKAHCSECQIYAFGPVVREFENLKPIFIKIDWLVFQTKIYRNNFLKIDESLIQLHFFKKIGGNTIISKLEIICLLPKLFFKIKSLVKQSNNIHLRAPSVPCIIALIFVPFYPEKIFWFKYAGSWVGNASFSYKVQRKLYKFAAHSFKNVRLTINGDWESHPRIFNFQNPCITESELITGRSITASKLNKQIPTWHICFVGNLTVNKGITNLLEAISLLSNSSNIKLHVVGGSESLESLKNKYESLSQNEVTFYGVLPPDEVQEVYKRSDFICLPSKSEGFPKVIGEAMNYGVIPIVTDVSSIGQLIKNKENGFLLKDNTVKSILQALNEIQRMELDDFHRIIQNNEKLVCKFTYVNYNERIKKHIFPISK
jgi:glycosyltransferase involved in cell wall biosynthesis